MRIQIYLPLKQKHFDEAPRKRNCSEAWLLSLMLRLFLKNDFCF